MHNPLNAHAVPGMHKTTSLRIALVTETFAPEVNGVAMTLGRLVQGLLARGHQVQVVRPCQPGPAYSAAPDEAVPGLAHVLVPGLALPTYSELRFGLPSGARLSRLWSAQRPDIVHVATEGPLGYSAVTLARQLGLPVSSSFHTNFHSYSQHYGLSWFKSLIESYLRHFHNRTQATLVPTRALVAELQARGYLQVGLLARGVATSQFSPAKRSQELRERWGAGPDDTVLLLVGRLAKEKNVGLVISAYQAILQQRPRTKLVFVGDGPLRQQLQLACPQAIFAGVHKDEALAMHYASGDVFLFPSLTETYGNVVPEALASGLAVLSYAHAAAKELIVSHQNGVTVTPGDDASFVAEAVALTCNLALQHACRQASTASVAHLDWDAIYDGFVETLQGVITHQAKQALPTPDAVSHASA